MCGVCVGLKAGNRLDLKEALEVAVQGRVKAHYELRPIEKLTEVSQVTDFLFSHYHHHHRPSRH
jgi:hypothetical protein